MRSAASSTDPNADRPVPFPPSGGRLVQLVEAHADFVWRSLRRLGVRAEQADDATQEVFIVAAQKIDRIEPARERAFLFGVAMNVAAHARRSVARKREIFTEDPGATLPDAGLSPELQVQEDQARRLLDRVLETMEDDLRVVFVLFELEEIPAPEIAAILQIPTGTVASRLRRARESFHANASRVRRGALREGGAR